MSKPIFCDEPACQHNRSCHIDFTSDSGAIVIRFCVIPGCPCEGFRELNLKERARELAREALAVAYGEGAAS